MLSFQEEVCEQIRDTGLSDEVYKVTDEVVWTVLRNSPKHYMPGDKIKGRIIDAFDNGGTMTYRIELDHVWNQTAPDQPVGEKIVIGNIRGGSLRRYTNEL